jgi:hypothetical protein
MEALPLCSMQSTEKPAFADAAVLIDQSKRAKRATILFINRRLNT